MKKIINYFFLISDFKKKYGLNWIADYRDAWTTSTINNINGDINIDTKPPMTIDNETAMVSDNPIITLAKVGNNITFTYVANESLASAPIFTLTLGGESKTITTAIGEIILFNRCESNKRTCCAPWPIFYQ